MRRIKNVSDEVISVPALGNRLIQPGETVELPDTLDDAEFSSAYFEDEGSTPKRTTSKTVTTADSASTEEGNQ